MKYRSEESQHGEKRIEMAKAGLKKRISQAISA
jgi:hypothetical protein